MQILIKSFIFIVLLGGCTTYKAKYPYSLADFNPELRVHLEKVIQNGGMCDLDNYDESPAPEYYKYFSEKVTTNDLHKLVDCEHPILRAIGFSYLRGKKDTDLSQILLNHLDDTAIITICNGEFGPGYSTVSDALISMSRRDSVIFKSILTEEVITKHPYLSHAYEFINEIEKPAEKYYTIIRNMAKIDGSVLWLHNLYNKKEIGLYALSKYRKKEDISYIANELSRYWRLFSGYYNYSFKIIEQNPDTAYFKIIEDYYRYISGNRTKMNLQLGFYDSYWKIGEKYDSFLTALASFKNKRSSEIIEAITILELYPDNSYFQFSYSYSSNYTYRIYNLLKENECPEYKKLIKLLKPKAMAYEKEMAKDPVPVMKADYDTTYSSKYDERYW